MILPAKEFRFDRKRLRSCISISKEFMDSPSYKEFIEESLTLSLEGVVWASMQSVQKIPYTLPRPKFLDWLFHRTKMVMIEVKVSEILANVQNLDTSTETIQIFEQRILP